MYTLICGSPKPCNSNSLYFLKNISTFLEDYKIYELKKDIYSKILENIKISDVLVLSFPLYIDCPTSIMLEFLDYIIDKKIKLNNKLVYVVINCGFREGEQNITGLNVIKRWCTKVNAIYSGSILIGAGEIVGKKRYKFISKRALKQLNQFAKFVQGKKNCLDIITTMDLLNNKMYCYLANLSWNKKCSSNKLSTEDARAI